MNDIQGITVEDSIAAACADFSEDLQHHLAWLEKQKPGAGRDEANAIIGRLTSFVQSQG